jgi:hypothetical protein
VQRAVVLGSAAAVSIATRDNTFLAFESQKGIILLDTSPVRHVIPRWQ